MGNVNPKFVKQPKLKKVCRKFHLSMDAAATPPAIPDSPAAACAIDGVLSQILPFLSSLTKSNKKKILFNIAMRNSIQSHVPQLETMSGQQTAIAGMDFLSTIISFCSNGNKLFRRQLLLKCCEFLKTHDLLHEYKLISIWEQFINDLSKLLGADEISLNVRYNCDCMALYGILSLAEAWNAPSQKPQLSTTKLTVSPPRLTLQRDDDAADADDKSDSAADEFSADNCEYELDRLLSQKFIRSPKHCQNNHFGRIYLKSHLLRKGYQSVAQFMNDCRNIEYSSAIKLNAIADSITDMYLTTDSSHSLINCGVISENAATDLRTAIRDAKSMSGNHLLRMQIAMIEITVDSWVHNSIWSQFCDQIRV